MYRLSATESATEGAAAVSVENASTWARPFTARLLEPGIVSYEDRIGANGKPCGKCLLRKETIDRCVNSFIGRPIVIGHRKMTTENMKAEGHGYVTDVFYNSADGWWYCRGLVDTDEAAQEIKQKGFSSCAYKVTANDRGGVWHNIPYAEEIAGFSGEHLAIVGNPRYEEANIILNSKTMNVIKWVKKNLAAAAVAAGGTAAAPAAAAPAAKTEPAPAAAPTIDALNAKPEDISPETAIEIIGADGKPAQVTLGQLVEAYNASGDMDGEDEIACNGKTYKLNALIQAFDKWTAHNAAADDEAKKKENAKAPNFFRLVTNAAEVAAAAPAPAVSFGTMDESLARGREMFGSVRK